MVWARSPVYFYQRNDIYYFSRAVPKDLQARFNKRRVEVSLKTKSADKARSLSMTLSDRLERYWPRYSDHRYPNRPENNPTPASINPSTKVCDPLTATALCDPTISSLSKFGIVINLVRL